MSYLAGFFGIAWLFSAALGLGVLAYAMLEPGRRKYRSGTRWCVWRWTDVRFRGRLYLRRLHLLQTPWFSVMLHWIEGPDPQPDMHDHPVGFVSWVLRGGYVEVVPGGANFRRRWSIARRSATDQHRIYRLPWGRTLTLVLAGPVVRGWGFHTPQGWVPWREYEKLRTH